MQKMAAQKEAAAAEMAKIRELLPKDSDVTLTMSVVHEDKLPYIEICAVLKESPQKRSAYLPAARQALAASNWTNHYRAVLYSRERVSGTLARVLLAEAEMLGDALFEATSSVTGVSRMEHARWLENLASTLDVAKPGGTLEP